MASDKGKKRPATAAYSWAKGLPNLGQWPFNPRKQAKARIEAVELVLNANLRRKADLTTLADTLTFRLAHGPALHDQNWGALRADLQAVKRYYHNGKGRNREETRRLQELHQLAHARTVLDEWEFGLKRQDQAWTRTRDYRRELVPVPVLSPSVRLIAAEILLTVEALWVAGLCPPRQCRYPRCGKWFVPTPPEKHFCCDQCRKDDHAVREGYRP